MKTILLSSIASTLLFGVIACSAPATTGQPPKAAHPANTADNPASNTASNTAENPDCPYVFERSCFNDEASACNAAGCEPGSCMVAETHPARVSCGE